MTERPRILVTNDDGYRAPGIVALEEALSEIADCYVVAPESEQSGASHSLTLARPLRITQRGERHWTVDGTPTDCVTLAINRILPKDEMPHLCCSGINAGANLGDDATYSGTVAGALESTILGVPGLAFSLASYQHLDYAESAIVAVEVTKKVLAEGLPVWTLLNVNVPPVAPVGMRVTRQGFKSAKPIISEHTDPRGKTYYWIGEERTGFRAEGGTDFEAIDEGYVSITPMRSDLTSHSGIEKLKNWNT